MASGEALYPHRSIEARLKRGRAFTLLAIAASERIAIEREDFRVSSHLERYAELLPRNHYLGSFSGVVAIPMAPMRALRERGRLSMKRLYEPIYRIIELFNVPVSWVFGSKPELAELIESGSVPPGRAIDLGCGAGLEAIFLI